MSNMCNKRSDSDFAQIILLGIQRTSFICGPCVSRINKVKVKANLTYANAQELLTSAAANSGPLYFDDNAKYTAIRKTALHFYRRAQFLCIGTIASLASCCRKLFFVQFLQAFLCLFHLSLSLIVLVQGFTVLFFFFAHDTV